MGGCMILTGSKHPGTGRRQNEEPIDPSKLCYCGYTCPEDCDFLTATLKNDLSLKKKVFEEWELEKRFGMQFDPDQVFCYACKPGDQPEGMVLTHCTVRECALQKGYQACIQCDELKHCDKELWTRFPEFHEEVVKMRERYIASLLLA